MHQLTVSPLHNQAPHPIRVGFRIGWSRWAQAFTGGLARPGAGGAERAGVATSRPARSSATRSASWCSTGREARFQLSVTEPGRTDLRQVLDMPLTGTDRLADDDQPAPGPDQPPIPVRLVTFNIHHGVGDDGRHDLPRLAQVLAAAEPT